MKTSLITTCLNEQNTILSFLRSIKNQSKKIDEIVIVDGGSKDKTVEIIEKAKESLGLPIQILIKNGNRSVGRNLAIEVAKNDLILCTDVGCILDKNWAKNISAPFTTVSIDVVSGFYYAKTKNIFEKCLATYTCVMSDKVNPYNFLPSSRSIAFRKKAWKQAGGYPEDLNTCEDLVFAQKMIAKKKKFLFEGNAFVYWPQRKNLYQAAKQFYQYALGDGQAHFFRPQTPLLYIRFLGGCVLVFLYMRTHSFVLGEIVLLLSFLYILYAIIKNFRYVKKWEAIFFLPLLQVTSDIAVFLGTTIGFLGRKK